MRSRRPPLVTAIRRRRRVQSLRRRMTVLLEPAGRVRTCVLHVTRLRRDLPGRRSDRSTHPSPCTATRFALTSRAFRLQEDHRVNHASSLAPGWPGFPARWTSGKRAASARWSVATASIWFTLNHGILNAIYYPASTTRARATSASSSRTGPRTSLKRNGRRVPIRLRSPLGFRHTGCTTALDGRSTHAGILMLPAAHRSLTR